MESQFELSEELCNTLQRNARHIRFNEHRFNDSRFNESPRIPVPAPTEFADVITTANSRLRAPLTTRVVKEHRRRFTDGDPPFGERRKPGTATVTAA